MAPYVLLFFLRGILFLAKLDAVTLNASAKASVAYLLGSVVPIDITGISEVIVGKLNGAQEYHKIGAVFWASWLLGFVLIFPSLVIAWNLSEIFFRNSISIEAQYFKPLAFSSLKYRFIWMVYRNRPYSNHHLLNCFGSAPGSPSALSLTPSF